MTQTERIENATTKQAVVFIGVYSWVILRNIGRAINKAVHKLPWLFIVITVVISFIVSFVFISKARAERDSYNKKLNKVSTLASLQWKCGTTMICLALAMHR